MIQHSWDITTYTEISQYLLWSHKIYYFNIWYFTVEEIIEDQDSVAEVVKSNGDGCAPELCMFKDCGMAFTADTRKHAYGIKHTHEEDHIHNAHRFKDPKKYFEKFKLEIATWDCNAEIFMSDWQLDLSSKTINKIGVSGRWSVLIKILHQVFSQMLHCTSINIKSLLQLIASLH